MGRFCAIARNTLNRHQAGDRAEGEEACAKGEEAGES
jgi:hypothetical protein